MSNGNRNTSTTVHVLNKSETGWTTKGNLRVIYNCKNIFGKYSSNENTYSPDVNLECNVKLTDVMGRF